MYTCRLVKRGGGRSDDGTTSMYLHAHTYTHARTCVYMYMYMYMYIIMQSEILLKQVGLSELEEELSDVHQHRVEHEALAH